MKCKGRECFVACGEEPLDEYCVATDGEKEMTCWIASEVGQRFTVYVQHDNVTQDFLCELWLDGQNVEGCMFRTTDIIRTAQFEGALAGPDQIRPYVFSTITLTDDEALTSNIDTSQLGLIRVLWFRVSNPRCHPPEEDLSDDEFEEQYVFPDVVMHESSKKLGGHRITLGEPEKDVGSDKWTFDRIDPEDSPYFAFTWRYRPKGVLQAQGIMPSEEEEDEDLVSDPKRPGGSFSTAGPSKRQRVTREEDRSTPDSDDIIEIDALEALEAQRDALIEQIRRAREAQRVKREASPIVLPRESRAVIDLTDD